MSLLSTDCERFKENPKLPGKIRNIKSLPCFIKYSTMGYLLTKPHFPFHDLSNCNHHNCTNGNFLCSSDRYCISIRLVCDGINHCSDGEDEVFCGSSPFLFFILILLFLNDFLIPQKI